jgi:cell division protein FtsW
VQPGWELGLGTAALVLLGLGLVMVASASLHLGDRLGDSFHYVSRHLFALALGTFGALMVSQIPTRWWARASTPLYFLGLASLALVLVPGVGKEVNGAVRWIAVGPFNLQTSKPMILLLLAAMLLMAQPDFGTAVVLLATALGMLFLGGAPLWQFAALVLSALAGLAALVFVSPYRLERVTSFLNPWSDPFGSGYQLSQALIAFGRGEWFGVGLGNGIQKQFYLPEAHTDFILAVIGEEFGLVGTLLVIAAFAFIVWRAFRLGLRAERLGRCFHAYLAQGVGLGLGLQALINIGVNVGLLPTKGLTLPFMSYGSNSLIVACMMAGLLLRIDLELRREAANLVPEVGVRWARA